MISFESADLDRFLAEDDGKPVTMLNLLRFKPDGGHERYKEYLAAAGPLVARYGAEIVYAGDGGTALETVREECQTAGLASRRSMRRLMAP